MSGPEAGGIPNWPLAYGKPCGSASFKACPEDFRVTEKLGFEATGSGEFLLVEIEKIDINTQQVAGHLARAAGVRRRDVSYSGLKDRQAVACQFFSIHLPGRPDPDLNGFASRGVRVISSARHHRKLRRGSHAANQFQLRLTNWDGSAELVDQRVSEIRQQGVPNYFGAQRFGRSGGNIEQARNFYQGEIRIADRYVRGLMHSSARAFIFNHVLARRISDGTWGTGCDGDVWMLAGSESVFGPEALSSTLIQRAQLGEIDVTGPMWGDGESRAAGEAAHLEHSVVAEQEALVDGLRAARLKPSRRRLRMRPGDLELSVQGQTIEMSFSLGRGQYATSMVREIVAV